ncbi:MAG: polyphosphate kinase 2 family protein [Actinobacteria bacterium]|nr:polyphosphate kinase 2 family protein [Actinomycetota bacterium]
MGGESKAKRWRVEPDEKVDVTKRDPNDLSGAPGDREATEAATAELLEKIEDLQERLWAENKQSLLVVLQAMDGGGKDGTIKKVFSGVNPQGCRVTAFKEPSPVELAHDFLWRVHQVVPKHGEIAIFNRSHYEDVLIVRVHDIVPKKVWKERYELISNFERTLVAAGTTVVKFFLHISKEEQADRFRKRLEKPTKQWKFRGADLAERKLWDDYQDAYSDAISKTSTDDAPWYVVPADHKWFRDWVVATVLVETLERMDPQFPEPEEDLSSIVVE